MEGRGVDREVRDRWHCRRRFCQSGVRFAVGLGSDGLPIAAIGKLSAPVVRRRYRPVGVARRITAAQTSIGQVAGGGYLPLPEPAKGTVLALAGKWHVSSFCDILRRFF